MIKVVLRLTEGAKLVSVSVCESAGAEVDDVNPDDVNQGEGENA